MKKIILLTAMVVFLLSNNANATAKETASNNANVATVKVQETDDSVKGTVFDHKTSETLAGAVITLNGQKIYTDLDGNFKLKNIKEKCQLKISMISYKDQLVEIDPQNPKTLKIELKQL